MKTLKINTVAKLVKMTPDAIRFYEKQQIINPKRSEENNYREFTLTEIRTLNDCRNLKNIGFSLEEIGMLMKEGTTTGMAQVYQKKEREILDQIEDLKISLERLHINMSANDQYLALAGTYSIKPSAEDLCYWYGIRNDLNEKVISHPVYSRIMDHQNLFKCTVRFPAKAPAREENPDDLYDFGLSIPRAIGEQYGFQKEEPAELLTARNCVYTLVRVDSVLIYRHVEPLLTWMAAHNFQPAGDIIGKVLNVEYDKGTEQRIYEVWIPLA